MSFKRFVLDYLNFTSRERKGIVGLLVLIALFYFLPDFLYREKDYSEQLKAFQKEIALLDTGYEHSPNYEYAGIKSFNKEVFEPFVFDPNTVEPEKLAKFGLPPYIIVRFAKYRNAGAVFYKKEDLKKLYGLKPETYERMEPYIKIENKEAWTEKSNLFEKSERKKEEDLVFVELNAADSLELIRVRGIGPYLCSKIMNYRNSLGGFVNVEQLYEIQNITPEQVNAFKTCIHVDPSRISPLNINTSSYHQLNRHPYITSTEANAILKYRKQHGFFKSKEDLEKVYLVNTETIKKISPYLSF